MFEKQISKNKLARMTVVGGDFSQAGVRSQGEDSFTVAKLGALLADDISKMQERREKMGGQTAADISEAEFELIMRRASLFDKKKPIPLEVEMTVWRIRIWSLEHR